MSDRQSITIEAVVHAPLGKAWDAYVNPDHVVKWNHASDDWHSPKAENDLRVGGKFNYRMEAKDGSFGFDFGGTYTEVREHEFFEYVMEDGRKVQVAFSEVEDGTKVVVIFDAEGENSLEMQRDGWQSILNNYKKFTESA